MRVTTTARESVFGIIMEAITASTMEVSFKPKRTPMRMDPMIKAFPSETFFRMAKRTKAKTSKILTIAGIFRTTDILFTLNDSSDESDAKVQGDNAKRPLCQ